MMEEGREGDDAEKLELGFGTVPKAQPPVSNDGGHHLQSAEKCERGRGHDGGHGGDNDGVEGRELVKDDGGAEDVPNLSSTWPFTHCKIVLRLKEEGDHGGGEDDPYPSSSQRSMSSSTPSQDQEGWKRVGGHFVFYDGIAPWEQNWLRKQLRKAKEKEEASPVLQSRPTTTKRNRKASTCPMSSNRRRKQSSWRKLIRRRVGLTALKRTLRKRRTIKKANQSGGGRFKCRSENCNRSFQSSQCLNYHMKLHDEKRTFRCTQCTCSFWALKSLRIHEGHFHKKLSQNPDSDSALTIVPAAMHKCQQCPFLTEAEQDWKVHMARHRREERRFKCSYSKCGRYFGKLEELRKHVKGRHENVRIIIPRPSTVCEDPANLKKVQSVAKQPIKRGRGPVSEEITLLVEDLSGGLMDNDGTGDCNKRPTIKYCTLKLTRCDNLLKQNGLLPAESVGENPVGRNETKAENEDNRPGTEETKEVVGVNSPSPTLSQKHDSDSSSSDMYEVLRVYSMVGGEPSSVKSYKCKVCHKSFPTKTGIRRHLPIHSGVKPFRCPHCSTAFMRRYEMSQHVQKDHPDGEIHHCRSRYCSESFCLEGDLKDHHSHFHVRKFKCQHCEMGFESQHSLRRHEMIHTVKPHKCPSPMCDERFRAPHELRTHLFKCQNRLLELEQTPEN